MKGNERRWEEMHRNQKIFAEKKHDNTHPTTKDTCKKPYDDIKECNEIRWQ